MRGEFDGGVPGFTPRQGTGGAETGGHDAAALFNEFARAAADRGDASPGAMRLQIRIALEVDLVGDDLQAAVSGLGAAGAIDDLIGERDRASKLLRIAAAEIVAAPRRRAPGL